MQEELGVSERRACKAVGQDRSTQRRLPKVRSDEPVLVARMTELALQYGRYGYRTIWGMLRWEGWLPVFAPYCLASENRHGLNHKRIERLWRREGLKVPSRQPKRRRLWLNDGSCVRKRPERRNHVWSYDFVMDRTHDGRPIKMLTMIDEFTRECLAIEVERQMRSDDVLHVLAQRFISHGIPEYIRSDNGSEFTATAVRKWLNRLGVKTLFIEPGSPWENGYIESFNSRLRDNVLNGEIFDTLTEAKVIVEMWRKEYNTIRPHSALGYVPPAPEAIEVSSQPASAS